MAEETPTAQADWVASATDSIIDVVDQAKTLGTENVVRTIRAVIFGLVAVVFAIIAVVFVVIIAVRVADAYLPIGAGVGDATWAAHLFIGSLLAIVGFGLWGSRRADNNRRIELALMLDAVIIVAIIGYAIIDGIA